MSTDYIPGRSEYVGSGTSSATAAGARGEAVVESGICSQRAAVVGTPSVPASNCIWFTADCTATLILHGDTVGISRSYLAGQWYPEKVKTVSVLSAGTAIFGYFQAP